MFRVQEYSLCKYSQDTSAYTTIGSMFRVEEYSLCRYSQKTSTYMILWLDLAVTSLFEFVFIYIFIKRPSASFDDPLLILKSFLVLVKLLAIGYGLVGVKKKQPAFLTTYLIISALMLLVSIFFIFYLMAVRSHLLRKRRARHGPEMEVPDFHLINGFVAYQEQRRELQTSDATVENLIYVPDIVNFVFLLLIMYFVAIVFSYRKTLVREKRSAAEADSMLLWSDV